MKQSKTENFFNENSKDLMKIRWVLIFSILVLILSCSKEDNDEYYVKYEVGSSTIYSAGKLDVIFFNENNLNTNLKINTKSNWETIIGPVKEGFKANIEVSEVSNNHGKLTLSTQISVSKNNGPFALKAIDDNDEPRTNVQLSYTIDF